MAAIALAAGALAVNDFLLGVFYDDGLYAGLAVALAEGQGYVHPHLPGSPAAVHYPPLYPLVLAPWFGLLPLPAAALCAKLLNLTCAAAAAAVVAWHAARVELLGPGAPRWLAPVVVAAAALAIPVLTTQSVLFAEPVFALFLALAIAWADRPPARLGPGAGAALAGGLAALALLTRSIAVVAGAGIALFLWRRGARRSAWIALAPVLTAAAGWGIWVVTHRHAIDPALALNYGSYGAVLAQAGLGALGTSAPDLPRPLVAITVGALPIGAFAVPLGFFAIALGAYGLVRLVARSAIGWTLVGYLAILAIWPYVPDRFVWAVLPWLGLAAAAGAWDLWRRPEWRWPAAAAAMLIVIGFAWYQARGFAGRWWETTARAISRNYTELLPAVARLPDSAIVATDDESLVWLHTRRRAVPLYLYEYRGHQTVEPPPAAHRAYLERQQVTHVLLAGPRGPSGGALRRLLDAYPGWLQPVERWDGGRLLLEVSR